MALAMFLQAVATLCLFGIHSPLALPAFVIAFGLGLGGLAVTFPLLVGECFGLRAFAKLLGVLMVPATLGGAIGPVLTGRIFDVTSSYTLAFALHLGAFLIGGFVVAFLRRPALDSIATQSA
jgi:MFS family permease